MALNPEKLLALSFPARTQTYGWKDVVLYALGIGTGVEALEQRQLRFVDQPALLVMPTMANVLAHPGFWMRELDTGIDWMRVLHGEQSMELHAPLPAEATVIGETKVVEVIDKGPKTGAVVKVARTIRNAESQELYATLLQTALCRGDGGFSGESALQRKSPPPVPADEGPPDHVIDMPTTAQQALIYRLSGDLNPLHFDPAVAGTAGYDRPIFHGLGTYGVVGHALMARCCGYDPRRVRKMDARFSSPVFPGETITVQIWNVMPGKVRFTARVNNRNVVVLNNGTFEFDPVDSPSAEKAA